MSAVIAHSLFVHTRLAPASVKISAKVVLEILSPHFSSAKATLMPLSDIGDDIRRSKRVLCGTSELWPISITRPASRHGASTRSQLIARII